MLTYRHSLFRKTFSQAINHVIRVNKNVIIKSMKNKCDKNVKCLMLTK